MDLSKVYTDLPWQEIEQFANEIDVSYYSQRDGQSNEQKCRDDQKCGKAAEWCAYQALVSTHPNISKPDMRIYGVSEKSFDCDLQCDTLKVSVKSCRAKSFFPPSWIFQRSDKHLTDDTYGIFVEVDLQKRQCRILMAAPLKNLKTGELQKESLRRTKVAIYLKDQAENTRFQEA